MQSVYSIAQANLALLRSIIDIANSSAKNVHQSITIIIIIYGGARGVMVIVVGNGHCNTCSNPRRECLHFTSRQYS